MAIARTGTALAAFLLTLLAPATAQQRGSDDPRFTAAATFSSLHGPGLAVGLQLTGPVTIVGRVEGVAYDQARGLGIRYDAVRSGRVALFGLAMGGVIKCDEPRFANRDCADRGPNMSVAGGAGAEYRISGRWSVGAEAAYWQAIEHDERYYDNYPSHFSVSAGLRFNTVW